MGDVQAAEDDARFGQQQDREHYVKAPGDWNRVEPPARGSTRHAPVTAEPGVTLGPEGVAWHRPRDTVLRFRRAASPPPCYAPALSAPPGTSGPRFRRSPTCWS